MPALATAAQECPRLTGRQYEIVRFIRSYRKKHGFSPSVREIRDAVEVSSTSTVHLELNELEAARVLRRAGGRSRAITLIEEVPAAA